MHPPMPLPLTGIKFEKDTWRIITPETSSLWNSEIDDLEKLPYVYFGLNEQDYLTFSQFMWDVLKKIEEYRILVCYYRKELDEPICNL